MVQAHTEAIAFGHRHRFPVKTDSDFQPSQFPRDFRLTWPRRAVWVACARMYVEYPVAHLPAA